MHGFQVECLPDEYKKDIRINKSQIQFIIKSNGKLFGDNQVSLYTHNINNDIVNIKPYNLENSINADANRQIRDYKRLPDQINTLLYPSKGGGSKLNGKVKNSQGKVIWCRHLAFEQLKINKEYHDIFSTTTGIENMFSLKANEFDRDNIDLKADKYYGFSLNNFGKCLAEICKTMGSGCTKYMLLISENHVMSVIIKH